VDESVLRPFSDKPDEGANSSYAIPVDTLAGETLCYGIFELKKRIRDGMRPLH
jgi:hypothetical protein